MSYIAGEVRTSNGARIEQSPDPSFGRRVDHAVGAMIRRRRISNGMTSSRLAQIADVDPATLVLIEAGVRRPAALDLMAIAASLHVDVSSFFGDD